jgi:two-component sensor histidine kinase
VLGLLAFIRTAHFWTVLHPDLALEDDAEELLRVNEELTQRLLDDPEAARCDLGQRLFAELEDLRGLGERRELERARDALQAEVRQKEILLKEINHRVKNSLQIVSSILRLQGSQVRNAEANAALKTASARVHAIAAVHERLYSGKDIRVVSLDAFLGSLCNDIAGALGRADSVQVDLASVEVPTDMAIPLGLVVNELVTNSLKYGRAPHRLALRAQEERLLVAVSDAGPGPATDERRKGLGSQIVEALAKQLAATVEKTRRAKGYVVELTIPLPAAKS